MVFQRRRVDLVSQQLDERVCRVRHLLRGRLHGQRTAAARVQGGRVRYDITVLRQDHGLAFHKYSFLSQDFRSYR